MSAPILETHELTIGYKSRTRKPAVISKGLTLSVMTGEVVCLIGPNGAGKSTLLRTLSGLQKPLSGSIFLDQQELSCLTPSALARSLSVVLTERVNVGMLSVAALVALGRYPYTDWAGKFHADDLNVINWAIDAVGARHLANRNVSELSDGERQKVMIARALAQQPHVILLDEPTAFLDLPRRVEMMSLLRQLSRETGTAILLSTHDLELALRTADRLWLLPADHSIRIGAPEDLVLSGALEEAFHNDGVEFDRQHGSFTITRHKKEHITLDGEGVHALWTQKALEREGFLVNQQRAQTPVHVSVDAPHNGAPSWKLHIENERTDHSTIYELIINLRNRLKNHDS